VIGSFWASDNTCEICRAGYQSSCVNLVGMEDAQAELMRIPLADGTLGAIPDMPADDLLPSFPAASDMLGTGWFGTIAAQAGPGRPSPWSERRGRSTRVLAAKQLGAERIIAMSRHGPRQKLA
jgi:hypothetical protein